MNRIKKLYFRQIALAVVFGMFIIGSVPAESMAYMVGTGSTDSTVAMPRSADMAKIQRVLESKVVSQKLQEAGLSLSEVNARLVKLSDQELHQFASQVDHLYAGGGVLGTVVAILIIVLLVLLILKITDRKIIVK